MAEVAIVPIGAIRATVGVLAICVVGYAYADAIDHGRANPFDFFGYFTNQTSLVVGVVLAVSGAVGLTAHSGGGPWRRAGGAALSSIRAAATACAIVVAVVYNGLVPGTGSAPPWVSAALHAVLPAYAVLDWVLVGDREPLPWRRLWIVLPCPLVWLAVVLVRGATDGWVPYGFLLPEHGAASLALHVAGLLVALLGAGALVWGASRSRGVHRFLRPVAEPGGA